ncbi:unnamed protein product [Cylindrotheca closterium]|uniref:CN hydrolase domain-containing protein n=1 Tax=Cylindrotheca closterium TaxID=2856 RepID=A0AAD2JIR5_9STRA|nr:unnamed protein product [Cylindrotheca closterium]
MMLLKLLLLGNTWWLILVIAVCFQSHFCFAMAPTSAAKKGIAAIAQLKSTSDKLANLASVAECARLARHKKASMLFLPECFGFIGENSDQTLENAEDPSAVDNNTRIQNHESISSFLKSACTETPEALFIPDDGSQISILDGLRTIAKESSLWISGGGMHIGGAPPDETEGSPRVYNTHLILDEKGQIQALYRKIHLFDVSIPGKVELRESKTTAPGTEVVLCDSPLGRLGLTTCYDMRFPELYMELVKRGAQIMLMPSAFTVPTGMAHWHTLLQARAIESQCYVLAAAQVGKHNGKRESFGHSLAVDPWGTILADAGGAKNTSAVDDAPPSIVTCEIDLDAIDNIRRRMPIGMHRDNSKFS